MPERADTVRNMTVAVVVKVWDGFVLATDSASSIVAPGGAAQVYNSGDKIFHLHRDLPVAAMTWGLGNIASASIATLAKDLRSRLMGLDAAYPTWSLNPDAYTVEEVALRLVEHMHGELYAPQFAGEAAFPVLGFLIAGYSAGERSPEAWLVEVVDPATTPAPVEVLDKDTCGWLAYAQSEAVERLWQGIDRNHLGALQSGLTKSEWSKVENILVGSGAVRFPVLPAMPLGDAIRLAEFMVNATSGYTHFLFGPDTVGGPTEVASASRHEGFRWIARKHYYTSDLNPRETGHAT